MAVATQSSTPVTWMPRLARRLAEDLEISPELVKIMTDESGGVKFYQIADEKSIGLVLTNPAPVNPNAGAGRRGFIFTRNLIAKVRTRGGSDVAGEDYRGLLEHWEFQDRVINTFLLLPHITDNYTAIPSNDPNRFPWITPLKMVGSGNDVKRIKDGGVAYESVLIFQVSYVPRVDVP